MSSKWQELFLCNYVFFVVFFIYSINDWYLLFFKMPTLVAVKNAVKMWVSNGPLIWLFVIIHYFYFSPFFWKNFSKIYKFLPFNIYFNVLFSTEKHN